MPDRKITDLVDGGAPQAADEFVVARAGDNNKLDWASLKTAAEADAVPKSLYDANTILKADVDDTPLALTMGPSTVAARLAAGNIVAATPAEISTLLGSPYVPGGTDVAVADGGTGASTAVNARTNLEAARIHVGIGAPAAPANGDLWWDTDDTTTFNVSGVITIDGTNSRVGINEATPLAALHLPAGTAAANTAPLRLTTQAVPLTVVEQGAVELVGNSLQFTQLAKRRGVAMSQSVRVTSTTVGNTAVESAVLLTAEHGANYLEVGKCEILTLLGTLEQRNNVNAFGTFRIKYAGVEIETVATSQSNAIAAGSPFVLRVWTTCRSTGAGTMQVNTILEAVSEADKGATTLANIDTTAAQNTTVTFQWNETNAANILVVEQAFVQCVETNK